MHLLRARLIQVLVHASSGPRPSDKGWGGGGGWGGVQKKCFRPFGPQFGLKIRGRPGPLGPWAPGPPGPRAPEPQAPGPLPWIRHSM